MMHPIPYGISVLENAQLPDRNTRRNDAANTRLRQVTGMFLPGIYSEYSAVLPAPTPALPNDVYSCKWGPNTRFTLAANSAGHLILTTQMDAPKTRELLDNAIRQSAQPLVNEFLDITSPLSDTLYTCLGPSNEICFNVTFRSTGPTRADKHLIFATPSQWGLVCFLEALLQTNGAIIERYNRYFVDPMAFQAQHIRHAER